MEREEGGATPKFLLLRDDQKILQYFRHRRELIQSYSTSMFDFIV